MFGKRVVLTLPLSPHALRPGADRIKRILLAKRSTVAFSRMLVRRNRIPAGQ